MNNFILIAVFAFGYGPHTDYRTLGEYATVDACRAAAKLIGQEAGKLDLMGYKAARFMCVAK
jgi:hypothetical protein